MYFHGSANDLFCQRFMNKFPLGPDSSVLFRMKQNFSFLRVSAPPR
jgi:hypothetical protein